ncbi:PilZ domain-containing protein [Persephonella sp.]
MGQEESKSIWKLIGWLKKTKKIEVVAFYEEVPINGVLELEEVEEPLEQIIWKSDKKLIPPLRETRHLYFKKDGEVYILTVIAYDEKEIATSFPSLALDKKLNRAYVRVKTSETDPVDVMINGIQLSAEDISEAGIGILAPEDRVKDLEVNKEYDIMLRIRGEFLKLKGIIVYKMKAGKGFERIGIKFTQVKPKDQDRIAKYIMDRQREIAKKIFLFKG